jgi:hypothetical protein
MTEVNLKEIEKQLQERALELEKQRLAAHESAMKEIAEAKAAEEKRRKAAQDQIEEATAKFKKREAAKKEAEEQAKREERELSILMEQEQNRIQAELDATIARKEALTKQMLEMEHQEELAKRELRDLIMTNTVRPDTERIMPHPLERFLQKEPT